MGHALATHAAEYGIGGGIIVLIIAGIAYMFTRS